jgi:hypothetical protein
MTAPPLLARPPHFRHKDAAVLSIFTVCFQERRAQPLDLQT